MDTAAADPVAGTPIPVTGGTRGRRALRTLTMRGRSFVVAGAAASACGIVLGKSDVVRIGVLIGLLPLITLALVTRSNNRLSLARSLTANHVEVGQVTGVQLDVTNVGARTGLLLVEDHVPRAFGHPPRFVLDTMDPGWHRRFEYPVQAEVRGIYEVGPMTVRVADPFGMVELHRAFTRTSTLVVVPSAERLPAIPLRGAWTGTGDNRPRPFSTGSTADVTVREYVQGDDLRRVHWRSTARTGELMVRREEQPWQSRCTLFIDNRERSHRGVGPDSSLERAVTVTASIGVHLAAQGFQVRLVSALGETDEHGLGEHAWHDGNVGTGAQPLLERLAALPLTRTTELASDWIDETVTSGMFIAVVGALTDLDKAFLARLHTRANASYALVLEVDGWSSRGSGTADTGRHRRETTSWLQQRGWKAAGLERGGSLPAAWQELGR